jgi:Tol biopolymer transport system component
LCDIKNVLPDKIKLGSLLLGGFTMRFKRLAALSAAAMLMLCPSSCSQKRQGSPGVQNEQGKADGYILFINAESSGKNVLYRVDAEGKKKERVFEQNPYSASGHEGKIAFLSKGMKDSGLYTINGDGSGLTPVVTGISIKEGSISWSPDGKRLVFIGSQPMDNNYDIFYVEAGKYSTPVKITKSEGENESPWFSNDGKLIVYSGKKNGSYDIYVYDVAGHTTLDISNNGSNDISPVISPDGTKVIFLSDEAGAGRYNLYMMGLDGSGRRELTADLNIMKDSISVSPDSSMISFTVQNGSGKKSVQVIDMNRTGIMISNDAYLSAWSDDSKTLYYASFDPKNRKIVGYDVTGKKMKDILKIEYKPGEEGEGIKFLYYTGSLK